MDVVYGLDRMSSAGGMLATRREIPAYPTRTNQIPRHIPPPHWASNPLVLLGAAGLLPFGTIFVELYFAMTSIWQVGIRTSLVLPRQDIFMYEIVKRQSSYQYNS